MKIALISLIVFSTIFAVVILYPFSMHLHNGVVNTIDPLFYAWNLSYNASQTFHNISDKINTNIFYPDRNTLAYSDTMWTQSLFATPIIWISQNILLAENLSILLTFPFCAFSMFLLFYYLSKNTLISSIVAIFYAFSYPRLAQIGHLPMLSSQFLPLFVLFFLQFLQKSSWKYLVLSCVVLFLNVSSSVYFGIFLIPVIMVMWIWKLFTVSKRKQWVIQQCKMICVAVVPCGIILGALLYPYILLKIDFPDIKRTTNDILTLRALPIDYITVLPTSILSRNGFPTSTNEHVLFPTITVIVLTIIGCISLWKNNRKYLALFLVLGCTSFILSLGSELQLPRFFNHVSSIKLPYYYLYQWFPPFQIIRATARFSILVQLSLCVLSGYGLLRMQTLRYGSIILSCIILLFLFETFQVNIPYVLVPGKNSIPYIYSWISSEYRNPIIVELPLRRFFSGNPMTDQLYISYPEITDMDNYTGEAYRVYFSGYHKLRMINGYSGFFPPLYTRISELAEVFPTHSFIEEMKKLGVSLILIHGNQYGNKWQNIQNELAQYNEITKVKQVENDVVYSIQHE